jgi:hypothetical protein
MTTFLQPDSPLRNPPATLEPRQIVALDGLRLAFDMVGLAYGRLLEDLVYLSENRKGGRPDTVRMTSAYLNAWSALDGAYRLRSLLEPAPERAPEFHRVLNRSGSTSRFSIVVIDSPLYWRRKLHTLSKFGALIE